jgi:hypothetical protein
MAEERKVILSKLAEIARIKGDVELRPLTCFSVSGKMPHEKDIEIGERLIRKKITK